MCFEHELAGLFGVAAHRPGSLSHRFPPSLLCSFSVVSLFPFPTWGFIAGFGVARCFQLWEQSPSRSWLPIVGAPGCLSHSSWKLIYLFDVIVFNAGHLVLSANSSLFVELMDHLLTELKQNASHSTTRTFIQCIGAIW